MDCGTKGVTVNVVQPIRVVQQGAVDVNGLIEWKRTEEIACCILSLNSLYVTTFYRVYASEMGFPQIALVASDVSSCLNATYPRHISTIIELTGYPGWTTFSISPSSKGSANIVLVRSGAE